jgi:hypothetical protein
MQTAISAAPTATQTRPAICATLVASMRTSPNPKNATGT